MKFRYGSPLTNPNLVETFESSRGIRMPEAYKAIVREHDGAYLEPAIAQVWNPELDQFEEIGCDIFVPFEDRGGGGYILDELNRDGHPVVPDGIIVFGKEGGGYLFGFDYRTNRRTDNPPVVLIHRDNSEPENYVLPVADTFDAFLAALESRPRPTK